MLMNLPFGGWYKTRGSFNVGLIDLLLAVRLGVHCALIGEILHWSVGSIFTLELYFGLFKHIIYSYCSM